MDTLPDSANLVSFIVTTAVMCAVTYVFVFNLQNITRFFRRQFIGPTGRAQMSMQQDGSQRWKEKAQQLREAGQHKQTQVPMGRWQYLGFMFHRLYRGGTRGVEAGGKSDVNDVKV